MMDLTRLLSLAGLGQHTNEASVTEGRMKDQLWDQAEMMDLEDFVANAGDFGMDEMEAAEFWKTANGMDEASTVNGVVQKADDMVWKSTQMSKEEAIAKYGKENVKVGMFKRGTGEEDVQVRVRHGGSLGEAPEDYPNVVSTKPGDGDYEKGFMYFDKVTGELYKTHPGYKVLSPDEFMAGRGEVKSGGDFAHMSDEELQDAINDAMEQGDQGAAEEYYAELEKRSMGESTVNEAPRGEVDNDMAYELKLYGENDGGIYQRRAVPIMKNLGKKFQKGTYDEALGVKGWMYWATDVAKQYAQEFNMPVANVPTRQAVAQEMEAEWRAEMEAGNFMESAEEYALEAVDVEEEEELTEAPTMDTTQLVNLMRNSGLSEEAIQTKLDEWANTPEGVGEVEPTSHGDAYDYAQPVNTSLKKYLGAQDMKVSVTESHTKESLTEAYKLYKGEVTEAKVDEEEVEEGNEFSGELAKAKAAGKKEFEVDGKKYQVKESEQLDEVGVNDIDDEECDNCGNPLHNGECPQCDADEKVDESAEIARLRRLSGL